MAIRRSALQFNVSCVTDHRCRGPRRTDRDKKRATCLDEEFAGDPREAGDSGANKLGPSVPRQRRPAFSRGQSPRLGRENCCRRVAANELRVVQLPLTRQEHQNALLPWALPTAKGMWPLRGRKQQTAQGSFSSFTGENRRSSSSLASTLAPLLRRDNYVLIPRARIKNPADQRR